MQFNRRLQKIEYKIDALDPSPRFVVVHPNENEEEKIAAFLAENPGRPYNVIKFEIVKAVQSHLDVD